MRIVVKVGSQQLLTPEGAVNQHTIDGLVDQLAALQNQGHQLVLVSSGAIACGRVLARNFGLVLKRENDSSARQLLAAVGQAGLMNHYAASLARYHMLPAQVLLTHQDFVTRRHYLNIQGLFTRLLGQRRTLAIVNENDSVAVEELMFTDNDQLAGMLAALLGADKLILLTNVEGVYSAPPSSGEVELIRELRPEDQPIIGRLSSLGRGGMASKLSSARKAASIGISAHIAHVDHPQVLQEIVSKTPPPGTVILASQPGRSPFKRWLASGFTDSAGSICVTAELCDLLQHERQARSILPVGVTNFQGEFQRGDLIDICNPSGKKIGIGLARYGHTKLEQSRGEKGQGAFIHYNYLYIGSGE